MLCGSWSVSADAKVSTNSARQLFCGSRLPLLRKQHLLRSPIFTPAQSRKPKSSTTACLQAASPASYVRPQKTCSYDVIALGNLCLDIFVSVPELPSTEESSRRQLLNQLTASPPCRSAWEVGGNTNFMIAAARLGMQVAPVGHLGPDEYGQYIKDVLQVHSDSQGPPTSPVPSLCLNNHPLRVLQKEGVLEVRPLIDLKHVEDSLKKTLLCFVLVAPDSAHSFCSRYDFGPWPLLPGVTSMPSAAWQASG